MTPNHRLPDSHTPLPTHCPVTGWPVYGHSSWTYSSPGGTYRLRVSFIGEQIVWLQPRGYVRLKYAQEGMALLEDVLFAMMPKAAPFMAIDDYSAVSGATLNARRFIIQTLCQEARLQTYIVYGPAPIFRLGLDLSRRFRVFPFEVVIARDYDEAATAAQMRLAQLNRMPENRIPPEEISPQEDAAAGEPQSGAVRDPLAAFADDLLKAVGGIGLEPYGIAPVFPLVHLDHPLRPVYDALSLLRDDMQAILKRHREAREDLELREKELTAKEAVLNETHTTLKVLFEARQADRHRFE
jgi:hypothetical protein